MHHVEIKAVNTKHILRRHFIPNETRCIEALEHLLSVVSGNEQEEARAGCGGDARASKGDEGYGQLSNKA